jgi:hypothetical protein
MVVLAAGAAGRIDTVLSRPICAASMKKINNRNTTSIIGARLALRLPMRGW